MTNIIDKIRVSGTDYTLSATSSGGNPTVELTQAEYDALVSAGTVSADTYYIITDAQAGDLTQYWTSAQTNSAINAAVSGKQDTLVSGTNIKTINNTSILGSGNIDIQGGGGKTVEAGRGISVASGDSAYTVSFSLPISAGTRNGSILENRAYESTGDYAHAEGDYTHAKGSYSHAEGGVTYAIENASHAEGFGSSATSMYSHAEGDKTKTVGRASHTEGTNTIANNISEHASGQYNVSSTASTTFGDSGNTLFSVGNGTSTSARHNAFEIRQNGDIYLSSGGTDIKLQDHLGGGGGITSGEVQSMIDESISGKADSSAVTQDISAAVSGKLDTSTFETYSGNVETALSGKQDTLSAGTGISISGNVISATGGGGGGMSEDDELLLATALTDLNDRKADKSEVREVLKNYQGKGDYVTTSVLNTRLADYETALDEQNTEEVTSYALNDLNNRFGGLRLVKLTQSEYTALTDKDDNTLYVVVADPT